MRKVIISAFILLGLSSIIGQLLIIRELLAVFYGNEISLGIILGSWLLWTALGSGILVNYTDIRLDSYYKLILCQLVTAISLPAVLILIRYIRSLWGLSPGEIIGLGRMLYACLLLLAPLGIVLGLTFTIGCALYAEGRDRQTYLIGRAYVYEAIGGAIGGILFTYILIFWLRHTQIALLISLLNVLCGFFILNKLPHGKRRPISITAVFLGLIILCISASSLFYNWDNDLRRASWPGFNVISSHDSIYGNLTLVENKKQYSLFSNGLLVFSYPDELSAEERVHLALLQHPQPKKILLISGGIGGALAEILKHPSIEKIDYLELDPLIIKMGANIGQNYLSYPKVNIKHVDARRWINQTTNAYDVILVNLPPPYTAQLNRFYALEFFKKAHQKLLDNGIIALSFASSANYIGAQQAQFLASIYYTLDKVFEDIIVLPGDTNFIFGCKKTGILTDSADAIIKRLKERRLKTKYVREYYIPYRFSAERIKYLDSVIKGQKNNIRLNTDFSPISYYYDMLLWVSSFSPHFRGLFTYLSRFKLYHWIILVISSTFIFFLPVLFSKQHNTSAHAVLFSVMTTGFAEITFEVIICLGFQIMFGYVYYKLGIILAAFMIGLALGGYLSTNWLINNNAVVGLVPEPDTDKLWVRDDPEYHDNHYLNANPYKIFILVQAIVLIYPLLLIAVFYFGNMLLEYGKLNFILEQLFALLPFIAGVVGGFQFPLANHLYYSGKKGAARSAGTTYALDLAGSCFGAIISSAVLLPILGIFNTCIAVSLLNLAALIMLFAGVKK